MRLAGCMIAVAALIAPGMASAQVPATPKSTTDERRLTPEQIETVLAEAAARNSTAQKRASDVEPVVDDSDLALAPQLHGEVGVSVGTGGYREIFGTGIYPLGNDGVAAISLDFVDWGNRRYPR